jgi:hypothetical protein
MHIEGHTRASVHGAKRNLLVAERVLSAALLFLGSGLDLGCLWR